MINNSHISNRSFDRSVEPIILFTLQIIIIHAIMNHLTREFNLTPTVLELEENELINFIETRTDQIKSQFNVPRGLGVTLNGLTRKHILVLRANLNKIYIFVSRWSS